jgi:hypothetical protein
MSGAEQKHRIRISLDIQSLKNNNFQGNVHVKHEEIRRMGISKFKTPSSLQLFKKHIEEQYFTDSFCSYEFDVAKEELLSLLRFDSVNQRRKAVAGNLA